MSQLLTEEQYKQITTKLLLTDGELRPVLAEMGLAHLDPYQVEAELNQGDFGYCINCGSWKYDIHDDWCEECRNDMEW
jgi:hypothetical protein